MFFRNMRTLALVMGPVILFVLIYSNFIQKPKADPLAFVGAGDPKMAAARDEGRRTLPTFLQRLNSPAADEDHFQVKFRLDRRQIIMPMRRAAAAEPGDEPAEFIWADRINQIGEATVSGFIVGTPRTKGFRTGQPVSIPLEDIVDWTYTKSGVVQGAFTTKLLLDKLPPDEARRARQAMGWQ